MTDLNDPRLVAQRSKRLRKAEAMRKAAMRTIMNTPHGRAYIYDLLAECHIYHNPFAKDPLVTAFQCGEMNVGQKMQALMVLACPELYSKMIEEFNGRPRSDADSDELDSSPAGGPDSDSGT